CAPAASEESVTLAEPPEPARVSGRGHAGAAPTIRLTATNTAVFLIAVRVYPRANGRGARSDAPPISLRRRDLQLVRVRRLDLDECVHAGHERAVDVRSVVRVERADGAREARRHRALQAGDGDRRGRHGGHRALRFAVLVRGPVRGTAARADRDGRAAR